MPVCMRCHNGIPEISKIMTTSQIHKIKRPIFSIPQYHPFPPWGFSCPRSTRRNLHRVNTNPLMSQVAALVVNKSGKHRIYNKQLWIVVPKQNSIEYTPRFGLTQSQMCIPNVYRFVCVHPIQVRVSSSCCVRSQSRSYFLAVLTFAETQYNHPPS